MRDKAARAWCTWEDVHVDIRPDRKHDPRYADSTFRMTFARLVTHYWQHAAFLEEGALIRDAYRLAGIPGVLVHGRLDLSEPLDIAWELAQAWPEAELVIIDDAAHFDESMTPVLVAATDRFAKHPRP